MSKGRGVSGRRSGAAAAAGRGACAAVAATGLMALGAGGAVAGAAPAVTTGIIHACYSNSTRVLSDLNYPTVKTCPSGSTMISWNATGPQGAQGPQGTKGAQGAQGFKGAQGVAGAQGAKGAQGGVGPQGATGARGATGPQGATGPKGSVGAQGAAGARGATGAQGARGAQGPAGARGPEGSPGSPGAGLQGYDAVDASTAVTSASTVLVSLQPRHSGYLDVLATVEIVNPDGNGPASCRVREVESSGQINSSTPFVRAGRSYKDLTTTRIMHVDSGTTVQEVCHVRAGSGGAYQATINATAVGTFEGAGSFVSTGREGGLRNRFSRPASGHPAGR